MKTTDTLVQLNIEYLRQGLALLEELNDETYTMSQPPVYDSGVGEHMRHIIEHYETFLDGLSGNSIDYDGRQRNLRISDETSFAAARIHSAIERLDSIESGDRTVEVKMAASHEAERDEPWSDSTVKRELQYLQAHTIHHYALIAMILRMQHRDVPEDFGVAPSTLRHRLSTDRA